MHANKKFFMLIKPISFFLLLLYIPGCSSSEIITDPGGGWINADTYRANAVGAPERMTAKLTERRSSAFRAGYIAAQRNILERFISARSILSVNKEGRMTPGAVSDEQMEHIILGGRVLAATYDDQGNCEVVYEIYQKNLIVSITGLTELHKARKAFLKKIKQEKETLPEEASGPLAGLKHFGAVVSVNPVKKELVVQFKRGEMIRIGQKAYLMVDNKKIELIATFPLITRARFRIAPKDAGSIDRIVLKTPVYK